MKFFENKSVFKKLIVVLLCILLLSFCMPKGVNAADDGIGGKLLSPVIDLLLALGDSALNVVHTIIYNQNDTLITVDMTNSIFSIVATVFAFVVTAVVVGAVVVFTSGAIVAALSAIGLELATVGLGTVILATTISGVVGAAIFNSNYLPDNLQLPVYSVSPEDIFSNNVAMFDVDFFNPNDETVTKTGGAKVEKEIGSVSESSVSSVSNLNQFLTNNGISERISAINFDGNYSGKAENEYEFIENNISYKIIRKENKPTASSYLGANSTYTYTIYKYEIDEIEGEAKYASIAYQLRPVISNWYSVLRNISLVALLSVLVYIGIRIIISSTAGDKSKYKQMLLDWIVAICLLFTMQYIMTFSNLAVEKVTDIFKSAKYDDGYTTLIEDEDGKIEQALVDGGYDVSKLKYSEDGKNYIQWKTNLLGVSRLNAQMAKKESSSYAGYALIFLVLVIFTIYFIFTYLKRVIYMAFLTLIAPLVALTYPIDKISDGKAQAFNAWFKEYIFNLLIQPMHLLLYTILVSSAFELAASNIIYSLVALGFMMPAEKLLRKFFGFSKAETPGLLGGAAGAAVMMSGLNKLLHKPPKGKKEGGKEDKGGSDKEDNSGIKYKDDIENEDSKLFGGDINPDSEDTNVKFKDDGSNPRNNGANSEPENNPRGPVNDAFNDSTGENNDEWNQWKDKFNNSKVGQGVNAVKDKGRKIKNNVSNTKFGRAAKAGMKYYGSGMKKKIEKKLNNAHPLRALPKVAGGVALGAAAGTLGLAAGITSGDFSKAAQYTAAAGAAGYAFGGAGAQNLTKALSVDGAGEAMKEAYYGEDEYKEMKIKENIRKAKHDDDIRRELSKRLESEEDVEMAMQDDGAVDYAVRYGLNNANEIAAVYERHKKGEDWETAAAQVKFVKDYGKKTSKLGHKDSDDLNKTIMDRVKKTSPDGISKEEMEKKAKLIREKFDSTSSILYKKI